MNKILKGLTYAYNRNIGWQDRTLRTIMGIAAIVGAVSFFKTNLTYAVLLSVFAIAQFGTVLSARCIICYFLGQCTIDTHEKKALQEKGIAYER
jgi:Protein of unknown function (DUF2892)